MHTSTVKKTASSTITRETYSRAPMSQFDPSVPSQYLTLVTWLGLSLQSLLYFLWCHSTCDINARCFMLLPWKMGKSRGNQWNRQQLMVITTVPRSIFSWINPIRPSLAGATWYQRAAEDGTNGTPHSCFLEEGASATACPGGFVAGKHLGTMISRSLGFRRG